MVTRTMLAKIRKLRKGDIVTVISEQYTYGKTALIKPGDIIVVNNSDTPYVRKPKGKHTAFLAGYARIKGGIKGVGHPCGIDYENVAVLDQSAKQAKESQK